MVKSPQQEAGRKTALGRRLLVLMILTILLIIALVWMSIYLFNADGGIGFDDLGIFALGFEGVDTMLPRIL
ncbi:hypothetical protein AAIB41_10285 [Brucella sp. BE17]|uniref:hypothetical protein n=1 Tax=Brucella sp. BE17 TaxID=3142977 RepID=UPI0031BAD92E